MQPSLYWELYYGIIFTDRTAYPYDTLYTQEEFNTIRQNNQPDYTGIDYGTRFEFLRENGYELTLDNITNPDLPTVEV